MCDDSDISAASSDEEIQEIIQSKSSVKGSRFTEKNTSLVEEESKRESRQKKIDEKVIKIQKHEGEFLLLFIPRLKSCHPKEITEALKKNRDFENVDDFSFGWNIKIQKSIAIKYVSEPYVIKGINFNVEYSKNNEKNIQKPSGEFKNRYKSKDEKKSVKIKNYGSFDEIVSPKLKQKATYTEKNSYQKDKQSEFSGNTEKKKSKYVLKESLGSEISKKSSLVEQENKYEQTKVLQGQESMLENEVEPNISDGKKLEISEAERECKHKISNPSKEKEETTSEKSDSIELETEIVDPNEPSKHKDDSETENDDEKVAEKSSKGATSSNKESSNSSNDEEEETEEKKDTTNNRIEEASEEEISSEEEVKVETKKKKKKKKKNNGFIDPNNRFSGFG